MVRFGFFLSILIFAIGCQPPAAAPPAKNGPQVQMKVGDGDEDDWGHLPFRILKVYAQHQPADAAPFHVARGDWTFFDCRTEGTDAAEFTVGVQTKAPVAGGGDFGGDFGGGKATIRVADRAAGAKFVAALAKGFKIDLPPESKPQPLSRWEFASVVLAEKQAREPEGGFSGNPGTWDATKWFLDRDGYVAEVFFNYDLAGMQGEFSEKDFDYREDLIGVLAAHLRDGPRPERTPENDPNLTATGPKFGPASPIPGNPHFYEFSPNSKNLLYSREEADGSTTLLVASPESPDKTLTLAKLRGAVDRIAPVDPNGDRLLVVEVLRANKNVYKSSDPRRVWWVEREKSTAVELKGPWEGREFFLSDRPVSPDGRFVAVEIWDTFMSGSPRHRTIHIFDRETGKTQRVSLEKQTPSAMGWLGSGAELRLVVAKHGKYDFTQPQEWFLAEPETGKLQKIAKYPLIEDDPINPKSPDGKLSAKIESPKELIITDTTSGERQIFPIHEDDRRMVGEDGIEWRSPHYLQLLVDRTAFIDTRTMKMSYPLPKTEDHATLTFSPDFRWVLLHSDKELVIRPVVLPELP